VKHDLKGVFRGKKLDPLPSQTVTENSATRFTLLWSKVKRSKDKNAEKINVENKNGAYVERENCRK
jgi:hypothetical protein